MKIELKNFKYSTFASQETHCYEATVYINGVKAFYARNDGHGGCDNYQPVDEQGKKLLSDARAWAKSLPVVNCETFSVESDLEIVIGDIINDTLTEKELKRLFKNKTVYIDPIEGECYSIKVVFSPEVEFNLKKSKGGDVVILNALDLTAAKSFYKDPSLGKREGDDMSPSR